ncbi:MAG TPA: Lpg1974 family pore-forming outer membrane protein, partial [Chlamydiales bacterium]
MKNCLLLNLGLALISVSVDAKEEFCAPPNRMREDVFLANTTHTFELEIDTLFLQPMSGNLHYAAEATPLPAPSPNWKIHEISTDYHFGFDLGLKGVFHSTSTNLSVNWERLHATDSASKQVPSSDMVGPFFEIGPDATLYKKAYGQVQFEFDRVNADYGIGIQWGDRLRGNFFSGVSLARIKQTLFSQYSSLDDTTVRSINVPSSFLGAGPQLGLDFSYRIVEGFCFTGKLATSFLVGTQKNHTDYEALSPALAGLGISPPNRQSTHVHKKTQVVPGFEGKLGLD